MINKYPDNTSYANIERFDKEFIFRINSYEDLWHLKQITEVYQHNGLRPTITIPWLIDGQADDRFHENQSFGLKLVCDFLNDMAADFKIFHPHNPGIVKSLIDGVQILDNTYFMKEVLSDIYCYNEDIERDKGLSYHLKEGLSDNLVLMSVDAGGFKPLMKLCDNLRWKGEVASASKSREYKDGKSVLTQLVANTDFRGKDILLVDDICIYGGTFKGLSKILKDCNCGKLYLAVSHMTVQNLGSDPITNYFDKVFTTNSKYDEYNWGTCVGNGNPENLEIIKLF